MAANGNRSSFSDMETNDGGPMFWNTPNCRPNRDKCHWRGCRRGFAAARAVLALSALIVLLAITAIPKPAIALQSVYDAVQADVEETFTGDFDALVERRYIRVLVPYSRTFFFLDRGRARGIVPDFLVEFEKLLRKRIGKAGKDFHVVIVPTPRAELIERLADGRGDIAIGNLTITDRRMKLVDFSDPTIKDVKEVVVTAKTAPGLSSAEDLAGGTVHVRPSSSYYDSLLALNEKLKSAGAEPITLVAADERLEDEDLMELVGAGSIPAIVVDDHKARFWSQILETIAIHENAAVATGGKIAWAVRKTAPKLKEVVNGFIKQAAVGTSLGNQIFRRYLKSRKLIENAARANDAKKLNAIIDHIRNYAKKYGFNWLMVAAVAYQESGLDQSRRSRVGAVGVMQVMPKTASDPNVNIKNIRDTEANIHAGVKYFRFIADTYFPDLKDKPMEQFFFMLAAYNAGPNRVKRLRELAKKRKLDPNQWFDNVEWLVRDKVGREPVIYVSNIYKYFVVYRGLYEAGAITDD